MRRFCEALPEDRLLGHNTDAMNSLLDKEARKRSYKIESTGATLTYHSAITVLARFASSLVKCPFRSWIFEAYNNPTYSNMRATRIVPKLIM